MEYNKIICKDWIEGLRNIPDNIFHCCVTSPPYWGQRDYGVEGQLGLEKTPEEHIEKLVEGFREVRRVLRDDGVLWVNYGDKYSGSGGDHKKLETSGINKLKGSIKSTHLDLDSGNLLMLPARVALALQADGWILRDDVIWAKAISFNDKYSGSTMPESVNGTRWERHRVKVDSIKGEGKQNTSPGSLTAQNGGIDKAIWQDCPGCPKCEKNNGLVLRKGSWRCTKAHEHIFQFVKSNSYFCDMEAVKEESFDEESKNGMRTRNKRDIYDSGDYPGKGNTIHSGSGTYDGKIYSRRNLRNVWTINPRGYKEAHYATYPESLIEPIIKVSTSSKGVCSGCRCQWARVVDSKIIPTRGNSTIGPGYRTLRDQEHSPGNKETTTLGWRPTCECGIEETEPALVLDPFMGSGTTAVVAAKLDRNYFGCEINPEYKKNHIDIRVRSAETGLTTEEITAGQGGLFE